ncbi:uncharacterized protein IL334_000694 [Kwoniella shivajii]|uniref:Metallo-beta-lactamase domain-containing protein n=1 Tax=Kwoniella shivajii TaxID=564305 RepID=A0ABZ1CRC6_9TREE|nr:hypothetical protein IL334_000694 [Kwoniella shivajii]
MAGIYNGHILEFPTIKIDCFLPTTPSTLLPSPPSCPTHPHPLKSAPNAQLFLLTHVHADHLLGLSDAFTGKIICSPDTKRMLLSLEAEVDRGHLEEGKREMKRLKYPGLRKRLEGKGKDEKTVDRIEAVPYGFPKDYEIDYKDGKPQIVTITLLDANHCPGSTMFLITSPDEAVLHTGDIRADKLFIETLKREPAVQPFIRPTSTYAGTKGKQRGGGRVLDRIYLDTGAVLGTGDMPDREPVLRDLVEQMSLFPDDTIFFLDTWCFGWEYVIKEVAKYFDEQVHVDRYKRSIYSTIETDPYLLLCTTVDPESTRFHACERTHKCTHCRRFEKGNRNPVHNLDKRIVSVNMVEIKEASWSMEHQAYLDSLGKAAIGDGPWPYSINVPLARHSPLPELQNLVKTFRPNAVSPNTVTSAMKGMDYYLLPDFLKDCIAEEAYEVMLNERDLFFVNKYGKAFLTGLEAMKMGASPGRDTTNTASLHHHNQPLLTGRSQKSSTRTSVSKDQVFRTSGLPALKPDEIINMMGGVDSHGVINLSVAGTKYADDYDTDEESLSKRRRKAFTEDSISSFPEASPEIAIKREPSMYSERSIVKSEEVTTCYKPDPNQQIKPRYTSLRNKKPSRYSLGSDDKERLRSMMERDRVAFEAISSEISNVPKTEID